MSRSREIEARSYTPLSAVSNLTLPLSAAARDAGTADSTRRAYSNDWAEFTAWCASNGHTKAQPAAPSALRAMLATLDRDTLIGRRDAALLLLGYASAARVSELVALDLADVPETELDQAGRRRDPAARHPRVRSRVRRRAHDHPAAEDRAPVLAQQGIEASVYRRKIKAFTDTAIPFGSNPATCPVRAVRALREAMGEEGRADGPLFVRINRHGRIDRHGRIASPMLRRGIPIGDPSGRLTAQAAAQVVERTAAAGLEGQWTGHSLRRGFATAARKAGHDLVRIGRHEGWADGSRALLCYFEDSDKWEDNPVPGTGL